MKLKDIEMDYRVAYRHNPSHFYPGTFQIEMDSQRLVLVAVVKRHIRKNYRVVGILKKRR